MAAAYLLHLVKDHPFVDGNSGRLLLITIEIYDRLRQKALQTFKAAGLKAIIEPHCIEARRRLPPCSSHAAATIG